MVFFAIVLLILYYKTAENKNSFLQNLTGAIFFIIMNLGFSSVFGSLNVFNIERPVFIR